MKRVYINPCIKVLALAQSHALLIGTYALQSTDEQLSRKSEVFDWEEDDEEEDSMWK